MQLREAAEQEAIYFLPVICVIYCWQRQQGLKTTMGLDPGIRTGVKVAIVDSTGKLLATDTIYPHQPRNQWQESMATLAKLIKTYGVDLVSIGNGTASRGNWTSWLRMS